MDALDAGNELEQGGEVHLVTQLQADKLQVCQFVDCLFGQCEFAGIIRKVENLASIVLQEQPMPALKLSFSASHFSECFGLTIC